MMYENELQEAAAILKFLDVQTYLITCAIASSRGLPKAKS
jgi:hypothetical protein